MLENFWYRRPDFQNSVHQCWQKHSYEEANYIFKGNITPWSNNNFGNIFKQNKILLARLSGIQKSSNYPYSYFLQNLESTLTRKYNNILKMDEDCWKIRSRINLLNNRDAKTKFFYKFVTKRRMKNRAFFFLYLKI